MGEGINAMEPFLLVMPVPGTLCLVWSDGGGMPWVFVPVRSFCIPLAAFIFTTFLLAV